jgi:hypothetical protein
MDRRRLVRDDSRGVVVAAATLGSFSATRPAVVEAAAVLSAFQWADVILLRRVTRVQHKLWPIPFTLFVVTPILFLGGLVVAVEVVSGFSVRGFWGYVAVLALVWVVDVVLGWLIEHLFAPLGARA